MPDFIDVPRLNFEGVFPYTGSPGASAQLRRPKIAASIEKYRLTCADSGRLGKQFLRPSHFSTLVYGTRGCWLAPCPGFAAPPTTPLLWSSRLVLGEVDAHFLEIGEVLIVSPSLIALEIRLSSMSTHGRLVFPLRDRGLVIYVAEARRVSTPSGTGFQSPNQWLRVLINQNPSIANHTNAKMPATRTSRLGNF